MSKTDIAIMEYLYWLFWPSIIAAILTIKMILNFFDFLEPVASL